MSYLRALVRKTQAVRPAIAPRLPAPVARPGIHLDELVEDVILTSPPAPSAFAAAAAMPVSRAPPAPPTANTMNDDIGHPQRQPPAASAITAARATAHSAAEIPAPTHPSVSLSSRVVSRRLTMSSPGEAAAPDPGEALPPSDRDGHRLMVMVEPPGTGHRLPSPARAPRPAPTPVMPREHKLERPDVQISIGRLEVRAHVAAPAKSERPATFRPQLTLQEYLAGRSGGH